MTHPDHTAAECEALLTKNAATLGGRVAVAVSGGVDSLTLATFLHKTLNDVGMFHAVSPAVPRDATDRVERLAVDQGWVLHIIDAGEFEDANYRANPMNRCFFCKANLYGSISNHTNAQIVSGANLDDLGEYRPGLDAAKNSNVRHPYLECKIRKSEVRALARRLGLGGLSELPAAPCLSSRVETGIGIRPEILKAIHLIERDLADDFPTGTIRCRVRATGVVVELDATTLAMISGQRKAEVKAQVSALFADAKFGSNVAFAPYQNGSAFLRGQD